MRPDTTPAIRTQLIAALEQRAATLHGEARRVLEERLLRLRARATDAPDNASDRGRTEPQPAPLRELVERFAHAPSPDRSSYPELPALADFRQLWSALRADSQLQQSIAHTRTDAGPLNSAALASRAIALMRALSPEYLRAFLAYVDELAWLEQLGSSRTTAASATLMSKRQNQRKRPQ